MNRRRLAWAGGIFACVFLLLAACGWTLKQRYCWGCTAAERYAHATELLCERDDNARERGLGGIRKLARAGNGEALALLAELQLQPLPERFALIRRDLYACVTGMVPEANVQALDSFRQLAEAAELSPELEYDLGVLVEDGLLKPNGDLRSAAAYFQQAASRGYYRAMFELGKAEDQQKHYAQAAAWFKEAFSRGGHPGAALMLGDYAFYGRGGMVDVANALVWYQKALTAAQSPEADRIARGIATQAQNRLTIANGHQLRSGGQDGPQVAYRVAGGIDEYRVYVLPAQELIGRVFRSGDLVQAEVTAAPEAAQEVASMNAGLTWILKSYAAGLYGEGQKIRFELTTE